MEENRRFQRVKLVRPLDGRIGAISVQVVDVSRVGVQVRHEGALPEKGARCSIAFEWNGMSARLDCSVAWTAIHRTARSADEKTMYSSGLRIESIDQHSTEKWVRMFEAIARGHEAPARGRLGQTSLATGGAEFVVCELVGAEWRTRRTSTREQPAHGFTVSASEDSAQVQRLCAAYLAADAETRKLIRSLSALSISGGGGRDESAGA